MPSSQGAASGIASSELSLRKDLSLTYNSARLAFALLVVSRHDGPAMSLAVKSKLNRNRKTVISLNRDWWLGVQLASRLHVKKHEKRHGLQVLASPKSLTNFPGPEGVPMFVRCEPSPRSISYKQSKTQWAQQTQEPLYRCQHKSESDSDRGSCGQTAGSGKQRWVPQSARQLVPSCRRTPLLASVWLTSKTSCPPTFSSAP